MRFPEPFVRWIKALYRRAKSRVLVRGFLEAEFEIKTGVQQECLLLPGLFMCGIKSLAQQIRKDNRIKRVMVWGGRGEVKCFL